MVEYGSVLNPSVGAPMQQPMTSYAPQSSVPVPGSTSSFMPQASSTLTRQPVSSFSQAPVTEVVDVYEKEVVTQPIVQEVRHHPVTEVREQVIRRDVYETPTTRYVTQPTMMSQPTSMSTQPITTTQPARTSQGWQQVPSSSSGTTDTDQEKQGIFTRLKRKFNQPKFEVAPTATTTTALPGSYQAMPYPVSRETSYANYNESFTTGGARVGTVGTVPIQQQQPWQSQQQQIQPQLLPQQPLVQQQLPQQQQWAQQPMTQQPLVQQPLIQQQQQQPVWSQPILQQQPLLSQGYPASGGRNWQQVISQPILQSEAPQSSSLLQRTPQQQQQQQVYREGESSVPIRHVHRHTQQSYYQSSSEPFGRSSERFDQDEYFDKYLGKSSPSRSSSSNMNWNQQRQQQSYQTSSRRFEDEVDIEQVDYSDAMGGKKGTWHASWNNDPANKARSSTPDL